MGSARHGFSCLDFFVRRASGSKKNDVAIVLPSGKNTKMLLGHLQVLSSQTWKKFDALVIGEIPSGAPQSINTLYYSELHPLGSSGSFAIGQILAYQLGYEVIINADLDCLPASSKFVFNLVQMVRKQRKAVLPLSDEQGQKSVYCINRYGAVPRHAMGQAGFEYAAFFKGAEDIDYQLRLERCGLLQTAPSLKTSHPYLSMAIFEVASGGSKYLYYFRAGMAIIPLSFYRSIVSLDAAQSLVWLGRMLYNYCYVIPYCAAASPLLFRIMLDGMLLDLGKRYEGKSFSIPSFAISKGAIPVPLIVGKGKKPNALYFWEWNESAGIFEKVARRVSHFWKLLEIFFARGDYFMPSAVFMEKYSILLPYAMFAEPVLYKGRLYHWGKGTHHLFLGMLLLLLALPLFPLVVLFSLVRAAAAGDYPPKTGNANRMLKNFASLVKKG